jgi:hypothetical protein
MKSRFDRFSTVFAVGKESTTRLDKSCDVTHNAPKRNSAKEVFSEASGRRLLVDDRVDNCNAGRLRFRETCGVGNDKGFMGDN